MNLLTRLFPTPSFIRIPAVGLDFSDATMRFIELRITTDGIVPRRYAEIAIPEGIMKGGRIVDSQKFIYFLKSVQKQHKLRYVHVSVPESQVYSVTLSLDATVTKDVRNAIELVLEDNIPLKVLESVFDYHVLSQSETEIVVQVVAMAESVARGYYDAFTQADMIPVSFELEGQAISRAVLTPQETGSYMIVEFGGNRTEITVITNGTAMVTSTIDIGGKMLTQTLAKELNISIEDAETLKREHGLTGVGEHKDVFSILSSGMSVLKEEINRRFVYWHDRKDQVGSFPAIDTIYICGGYSNLRGLDEYLSSSLKVRVVQANPWKNCLSLDTVVPAMSKEVSMSYVTAIGLALADYMYD